MGPAESKTELNIQKAFKAEMRARASYQAYAQKAESEGNPELAKLFRAVAASEEIHSQALLRCLKETSRTTVDLWAAGLYDPESLKETTATNLQRAIEAETEEFTNQYPQMIQDADTEGWTTARETFHHVNMVERVHAAMFREALDQLGRNQPAEYHLCEVCGNTIERKPIGPCEVCDAPEATFQALR
ncbi:rubrerythrin family protein [Geomonas sp. RF6]|uniref:rubrerythrin family protein n=1 Tax=Geomonas sp. RF6 TaxID=2897342 RepID=UPI001E395D97|nr:rubrerythrin family protein [Geomonas sp. RF6]UFS70751.1 rubrerythrin family protein [Geomonas sp. RF6]